MKLSCFRYLFAGMLFFLVTTVLAASASEELSALLNTVRSMQAGFTQIVYDNQGKQMQKSYGHMAVQQPGKFRWDVKQPIPQLIIANQTRLWIYDPDLAQVTVRSLDKASAETPALLLSQNDKTLDKHFKVSHLQRGSRQWQWFALKPKQRDNMFESIQFGFLNKQIREMRLRDNLGNNTVIRFHHIQLNVPVSSTLFTFKPSAKIDVIDESHKK